MRLNRSGNLLRATVIAAIAMMRPCYAFSAQQSAESPVELVRRTVQREIAVSDGDSKVRFTDHKETPRGSQTKLVAETQEGMAGMVVAINDKPLTTEQRQAEEARLERLMGNLEELKKKHRTEKEDAERITRIVKALPDAFLYDLDGTEVGSREVGKAGEELVRLKFRPNPKYNPPSRVEQVLTGMQGYILVDPRQHRIAKIDGTLSKDVSFGWGFLGHLDKSGHFLVEQAEVINQDWELTRMSLSFTGKVLLFKSLSIKADETFSDFHPVPSTLSFAQGVELLKQQEAELTANRQQPTGDKPK